jgi:hypothetical protein
MMIINFLATHFSRFFNYSRQLIMPYQTTMPLSGKYIRSSAVTLARLVALGKTYSEIMI